MIKILVSTTFTQGYRANDFCYVPENEIVRLNHPCHDGYTDDNCGCRRCLIGVFCSKGTTTAKVVEFDGTQQDLFDIIDRSYEKDGWPVDRRPDNSPIVSEIQSWPIDTIFEFRDGVLQARIIGSWTKEDK